MNENKLKSNNFIKINSSCTYVSVIKYLSFLNYIMKYIIII